MNKLINSSGRWKDEILQASLLKKKASGRSSGGTPVFDDGGTKKPTTLKIDFKPGPIFDLL